MRNADYWRGRFSILEDSAHREAQKTIQDMEELYLDAQRSVQKEIESWYAVCGEQPNQLDRCPEMADRWTA